MKKITLKNITPPDPDSVYRDRKKYTVSLGNGYQQAFSDYKKARSLLHRTSEFLTGKLSELNEIYTMAFSWWRANWMYFSTAEFNIISQRINARIQQIGRSFELVVERCGWRNGNHFAFGWLQQIASELTEIFLWLIDFMDVKGRRAELYFLQSVVKRIRGIREELDRWPS